MSKKSILKDCLFIKRKPVRNAGIMGTRSFFLGILALWVLIVTPFSAEADESYTPKPKIHVFPNGLRLITVENPYSPIVTFQIWYKVGSIDEHQPKTGISHFLEHMMFTGTPKFPHGVLDQKVNDVGGQSNAFTNYDYTAFFENLPPGNLPLSFAIESDRMKNLSLKKSQIERERKIVLEERRNDYDDPTQLLVERVYARAFVVHPYHNPVIGWEDDIKRITQKDLRNYYHQNYMPNNATIVIVGPVKEASMIRQVGDAFGSIPRGILPKRHIHLDRPQKKLQVVVLHKPAMLPVTMLAFHAPNFKNPDQYPLTVLSALLSGGRSSILYRKMVYEHPVAVDAEGSYDPLTQGPSLFYFYAQGMPKTTPPFLKKELTDVIHSLKTHPVSQSALERAKKGLVSEFLMSQESTFGMGMLLGEMATLGVPMTYLDDYVKNIQAVTPSDITRVAQKYLNSHSETIGYLYPSGKPKRPVFRKPGSLVR